MTISAIMAAFEFHSKSYNPRGCMESEATYGWPS